MGYQPQIKTARKYDQRHEKVKAKAMTHKRRSRGSYLSEEKHDLTSEEVVDRTLNRLRILGNQRFAFSPFNEHFDRWLMNLRDVLSEFESSPTISVDDQFVKERSQILSKVELDLEERRHKETSREDAIKSLSDTRILLEQIEKEYNTRMKKIEARKDSEIKRLSSKIDGLKEEVERLARTKMGILGVISKKTRTQKEAEATQKLNSAQGELTLAMQYFIADQERLRDEYERKKQPLTEHIRDYQKEVENQEVDASLETRRVACEALVNAVNVLLQKDMKKKS